MKNRINIAIDLETASLRSDAAILSIAAQVFQPERFDLMTKNFLSNDGAFNCNVNLASCGTSGLHIDNDTMMWWSKQSDDAKASILMPPVLLSTALQEFSNWLAAMRQKYDADILLWAQGSDFDFPILRNAFRVCGLELPWDYKSQRDARTFILEGLYLSHGDTDYHRIPDMNTEEGAWVRHSALSDAQRLAWNVSFVTAILKELVK